MHERVAIVTALTVALGTLAFTLTLPGPRQANTDTASSAPADCPGTGPQADGSVVLFPSCPGGAISPDGRWALRVTHTRAQTGRSTSWIAVFDHAGRRIGVIPHIDDAMPATILWSPRANWLAVSAHRGLMQILEIQSSGIVEHIAIQKTAQAITLRQTPCLSQAIRTPWWLSGVALRWSRDGSRIAWATMPRVDDCYFPNPAPNPIPPEQRVAAMLLISDAETGAIIPQSMRAQHGPIGPLPTYGPYHDF